MINDIFIDQQELETDLKNMQQMAETLDIHFPLISQKVAHIFSKIKKYKTMQEAKNYFELLKIIQTTLSCLLYKYGIGMPDRLIRFVQDFDNFEEAKEYYFKKIISGEYSF